jgi:hypothetical protein
MNLKITKLRVEYLGFVGASSITDFSAYFTVPYLWQSQQLVNVIHARPSPYFEPSLRCRLSLLTIIVSTVIIKHTGRLLQAPNKTVNSHPIRSHAGGGQHTGKFCAKGMRD